MCGSLPQPIYASSLRTEASLTDGGLQLITCNYKRLHIFGHVYVS